MSFRRSRRRTPIAREEVGHSPTGAQMITVLFASIAVAAAAAWGIVQLWTMMRA